MFGINNQKLSKILQKKNILHGMIKEKDITIYLMKKKFIIYSKVQGLKLKKSLNREGILYLLLKNYKF